MPTVNGGGLQTVQLHNLRVSRAAAEFLLGDPPERIAALDGIGALRLGIFSLTADDSEVVHCRPSIYACDGITARFLDLLAEQYTGLSALVEGLSVYGHLGDDVIVVCLHPVWDQGAVGGVPLGAGSEGHDAAEHDRTGRCLF